MRIVAGEARGRRLHTVPGTTVRPTSDRVRESLFNSLGSLGAIDGANVLDLFAGSGAMGIEALSRGARSATFVDEFQPALDVVRQNLTVTAMTEQATVVRADAIQWLTSANSRFDLALLDPPYSFDRWEELLSRIDANVVVIESDRAVDVSSRWQVVRDRRYGSTEVRIALLAT